MSGNRSWNQWTCPYCNMRMHHTERRHHEETVHAGLREAERMLMGGPATWRLLFIFLGIWCAICMTVLVLVHLYSDEHRWLIWVLVASMGSIVLLPIFGLLFRPESEKEAEAEARRRILSEPVRCVVCGETVTVATFFKHTRALHRRQWRFEIFRLATLLLFVGWFLGMMLGIAIAYNQGWIGPSDFAMLVAVWAVGDVLLITFAFYMSQAGEEKHNKKVQEEWSSQRFDPKLGLK